MGLFLKQHLICSSRVNSLVTIRCCLAYTMMGTDSASRIEELNGLDHLTGKDVAFVSAAQRCTKNEVKGLAGSRIWRLERKKHIHVGGAGTNRRFERMPKVPSPWLYRSIWNRPRSSNLFLRLPEPLEPLVTSILPPFAHWHWKILEVFHELESFARQTLRLEQATQQTSEREWTGARSRV